MTIQISKIQLRRGLQSDLPGATTPGLDVGEIAYTTDTNRLFIGTDPGPSGTSAIINRIHTAQNPGGFPYDNVEILTEFSPANQIVFDTEARNITSAFLISTPLAITGANAWATVNVLQITSFLSPPQALPFLINAQSASGAFGSALISYHMIDQITGAPLRSGRLTLFYQGNAFPPSLVDEAVGNPFAGFATGGQPVDPNLRYGMIAFQAVPTSLGLTLQYQIAMTGANLPQPMLYFRVEQPAAWLSATPAGPALHGGSSTIITINNNAAIPYDIVGDILDPLNDAEIFFQFVFVRAVAFPAGLASSRARCGVAPSSAVVLPISVNGLPVGSLNFAANATAGSFVFPANLTLLPNDLMVLKGPSPIDATFNLVSYTISGTIVP